MQRREGLAWALLGVALFSFSVPLTKVAVGGFDPFLTATARAVIAGVLAATLLAARREPLPGRAELRPLVVTMLGAVFGWPILLALALERTTSAHVAVIAAFMPLTTALIAVLRTHERVSPQFWLAACAGTGALIAFALTRGGADGGDLVADALVVCATIASSWCYVEGASITRTMPGWEVISWVVVLALPLTVPATAVLWFATRHAHHPDAGAWNVARPPRHLVDVPGLLCVVLRPRARGHRARGAGAAAAGAAHAPLVGTAPRRARGAGNDPRRARGDRRGRLVAARSGGGRRRSAARPGGRERDY
jgi:drug/metabolite transporter (DMT)-like permease